MKFGSRESGALPWWFLHLPGAAEQVFDEQTSAERNTQLRFALAMSLVFYWLCLPLDAMAIPDIIWWSFWVRLCFMTPLSIAATMALRAPRSRKVAFCATILPPALCAIAQLVLFAVSSHDDPQLDFISLALITLWVNALYPMRVSEALLFSVITVGFGDAVTFWSLTHHGLALQYPPVITIVHVVAFFSVLSRMVAEQNVRRSFAKGITLQLHVDDLSRANSKLLELSHTDPLTGLANRRYFDTTLEQAWQRAIETRQPLAVLMIDVDYFKLFNDTAGHQEGDRCLVTIAQTIDRQLRKGHDTVARFGGEEFVVLMPDTDADLAARIADRVHAAISAQRVFHPRSACGFVSVSIGVAAIRPSAGTGSAGSLIAAADKALYEAKAAGRDQVAHAFA